jgi:signal transduction histidine kinase
MIPMEGRRRWWGHVFPSAEEQATLDEIELPPAFRTGTRVLALVVTAVAIVGSLAYDDGDDRVNVVMVVATAFPWMLGLLGVELHRLVFAAMVLLPTATLAAARAIDGSTPQVDSPVSSSFCEQFALFLILLMLVDFIVDTNATQVVVAASGAYLAVLLQFVARGDTFNLAVWSLGVTLMIVAGMGLRVCVLAIIEARDLRAAQAASEERRQIARDVHDVVAHTLAVTMLHVTAARMAVLRSAPTEAVESLEEAERSGRASLSDVRRIVRLLRAVDDPPTALDAAQPDVTDIPTLVDGYRSAGLDVAMTLVGSTERVSPALGLTVYRVAQEALANAARHGDGTAALELLVVDGEVRLNVSNAAMGTRAGSRGSGLTGMEERVAATGGQIDVGQRNARWVVRARLPLAAAAATGAGAEA